MYLSSGEMDRPVAVPLDRGYRDHLAGREAEKLDRSTAIRVGLPEIDSFADQRERVPGKGRQNFRLLTPGTDLGNLDDAQIAVPSLEDRRHRSADH